MTAPAALRSNGNPMQMLTAEWILPVTCPPVRKGAVVIKDDSIIFTGSKIQAESMPEFSDSQRTDLGNAVILPGFVNVHAHLELTLLRGYLEELEFHKWIVKLTKTKNHKLTTDDLKLSALLGAAEAIRAGITTIADTGETAAAFNAMIQTGMRGVAYREVFGPDPNDAESNLARLKHDIREMQASETRLVKTGISPHAPYTVSAELYRQAARYSSEEGLDICIHAAESKAEEELMLLGKGDFALSLRQRGINWVPPRLSSVRYFHSLGILEHAPLLVHCVRTSGEDLSVISESGSRIAHCPKSNAKLGHGIAPFREFEKAGAIMGLGTDSVASNNRCDMISEAQFCGLVHRAADTTHAEPSAERLLRLATIDGARALRLDGLVGSLEPGKQADIICIDLSSIHNFPVNDPISAIIFSAEASDVKLTIVAGRTLYDGERVHSVNEEDLTGRLDRALQRMHGAPSNGPDNDIPIV